MKPTPFVASILLAALSITCGGGSGGGKAAPSPGQSPSPVPAQASALNYADPTSGTYQLKRNPTLSSKTHLVLDLWGPAGLQGSGVTVTLSADSTKLSWTNVANTDAPGTYVANGTVFNLGTGTPILKAQANGDALVATVAEKGIGSPKSLAGPLLRVALDLKVANLAAGTALALSADGAKSRVLLADGSTSPIAISTGNLTAQ